MGVLGAVSKLVALVAVAVGTIGKVKPELFLKLPMGFIPWAITGNFVPPYFDNAFYKSESFRDWVRDGDVIVSVGAKSGTTWMSFAPTPSAARARPAPRRRLRASCPTRTSCSRRPGSR